MARWIVMLLFSFGVVASASAQEREDIDVFRDVATQVQRYVYFSIFDAVHASVQDGVVTLTGKVTMPFKAGDIEKRVAKVEGVKAVRSRLTVLPVSRFDDELRWRVARAIYAHPALSMYGLGPNPSIHIVVERGRLTLDGVVNNDMDRQIARAVAGSFSTFGITNALKTTKEVEDDLERL